MKIMISTMLHLISSSLHHYDDCDNLIVWFFMTMISTMVIVLTKMMIFPPFRATLTLAPHRGIVVNRISDAAKYIVLHIPVPPPPPPPPPWAPFIASTDFYEMWFTILQKKQNNLKRQLFIMQIPILVRWRLLCQNGLRISVFHNGLEFGTFKKMQLLKSRIEKLVIFILRNASSVTIPVRFVPSWNKNILYMLWLMGVCGPNDTQIKGTPLCMKRLRCRIYLSWQPDHIHVAS